MSLQALLDTLNLQNFGPALAPVGQPVTFGVVPDITRVSITEVRMVDVALDFIGKGVIFPNTDLNDSAVTGALPFFNFTTVPPSTGNGVQGLIGRLRGQMPVAVPTEVLPQVQVSWRVTDAVGNDLIASGDAVAPSGLGNRSLEVLFVPEFVELTTTLTDPGFSVRRISAEVRLSAGGTTVGPRTLGPVEIRVPRVPLPTLLTMCVHKPYHGPTLILVPGNSALPDLGGLTGRVQALQALLNPIRTLARLAALIGGLDLLKRVLDQEPHVHFRKTDAIGNLNDITLVQRAWYQNDTEAEDELSSMFLITARDRGVECFNARKFSDGEGKFTLRAGTLFCAGIRDLHHKRPVSEPAGTEIQINKEPPGGWFNPDRFGDELSSMRFLTVRD